MIELCTPISTFPEGGRGKPHDHCRIGILNKFYLHPDPKRRPNDQIGMNVFEQNNIPVPETSPKALKPKPKTQNPKPCKPETLNFLNPPSLGALNPKP